MPKYKLTYEDSVHVFDSDAFLLDEKKLQGQEYAILNKLVKAKGSFVRKDVLCDLLWNDDIDADKHNIKTPISQLRSKFGKDRKIIEGVKFKFGDQAGYHIDCRIEEINDFSTNIFASDKDSEVSEADSETVFVIRELDFNRFNNMHHMDNNLKKCIAIKGDGGMGKTTFAYILYNRLRKKYSSIGWVLYSENLDETLLKYTDKWKDEKRDVRLDKINDFFKNPEKKLLIIDNVIDNPDYNQYPLKEKGDKYYFSFEKLRKDYQNLDVIITTRFERFPGYTSHELLDLDITASFELFVYYFDTIEKIEAYDYEDIFLIKKIVEIAHNNLLLIKAFAQTARYRFKGDLNGLYNHIKTKKYQDSSIVEKIRDLYSIESLTPSQQKIVWEFAILPNISLDSKDIAEIMQMSPENSDLIYLVETGWISSTGRDGFSMHDVIKESILSRCAPNPYHDYDPYLFPITARPKIEGMDHDDYRKHTYFYYTNENGIAPRFCYEEICSTQDNIDALINNSLSINDIKKRVDVLIAITKYVKLNSVEMEYILFVIAYNTYHRLGDKASAEVLLKKALECNSWALRISRSLSRDERNKYTYSVKKLNIKLGYELAYALSSMGYNKLGEAYELMSSVLTAQSSGRLEDYRINEESETVFPDLLISKELESVKSEYFNSRRVLLSSCNMMARILDHAAYIITIYKPSEYMKAEKFLISSLSVRQTIFKINSLRYMNKKDFNKFIEPYTSFFENIYAYVSLPVINVFFKGKERPTIKTSTLDKDTLNSVHSYLLSRMDLMKWDEIFRKNHTGRKVSKIDVIEDYFNYFSDSSFLPSLQDLATTEDNLGYLYIQMKRLEEAEYYLQKAKDHRKELGSFEPKRHLSELSWTYNNIGELYLRMYEDDKEDQHLTDAITNYAKAVELRIELNELFNNRYLDNLAWSYMGLWRCYLNKSDSSTAENYQKKALKIYENLNGNNQYDDDIKILNSEDPLSEPLNWVGNQSHFRPNKKLNNS